MFHSEPELQWGDNLPDYFSNGITANSFATLPSTNSKAAKPIPTKPRRRGRSTVFLRRHWTIDYSVDSCPRNRNVLRNCSTSKTGALRE